MTVSVMPCMQPYHYETELYFYRAQCPFCRQIETSADCHAKAILNEESHACMYCTHTVVSQEEARP